MKSFFIATGLLFCLLLSCFWFSSYLCAVCDELMEEAASFSLSEAEWNREENRERLKCFQERWERERPFVCIGVNAEKAEAVDEALLQLLAALESDSFSRYRNAEMLLKEKIRDFKLENRLSFHQIL